MATTPERLMRSGLPLQKPAITASPDTALPHDGYDGIDVTLIHWMLSLTPAERLQVLQQAVCSLERLRRANPDH
jgi:hypothetical protein